MQIGDKKTSHRPPPVRQLLQMFGWDVFPICFARAGKDISRCQKQLHDERSSRVQKAGAIWPLNLNDMSGNNEN